MLQRRKIIQRYLNEFIPNVISNLISEYDYELSGELELILKGHTDFVEYCAVLTGALSKHVDEKIVSASADNTLKIWNTNVTSQFGKEELTLKGHTSRVVCCAILNDGRIVSGSRDGTFKIWNSDSGICELSFDMPGPVGCCAVLPNNRIVVSYRNKLGIWNILTGKCEREFEKGDFNWIVCCSLLPDGRIVSGSSGTTLTIWNTHEDQNGKSDLTLEGHTKRIICCAILLDERIVSGAIDKTLKIWNCQTGKCEMTLNGHGSLISCCAVLPNGCIISGSYDESLKIWNQWTGKCERTINVYLSIECCAVLSDGRIVIGTSDNTLKILC
jgi:WD40 repeat protein